MRTRPDTAERNRKRTVNLTGRRFGRLVALHIVNGKWLCKCDCGRHKIAMGAYLRNGDTRSCGCLRRELAAIRMSATSEGAIPYDLSGQRFGRLVATKATGVDSSGLRWRCQCDCGNAVVVQGRKLREGLTRSCGCLQREVATANILREHWRRIMAQLPEEGELYVDK